MLRIVANCSVCKSSLYMMGQPVIHYGMVVIEIVPCQGCTVKPPEDVSSPSRKEDPETARIP